MKNDKSDGRQLKTLEQVRAAELEQARVEYVTLARTAEEKKSAVDIVMTDLEATQLLAREQMTADRPISVEALHRIAQFAAVKAVQLDEAKDALRQSEEASEAARDNVTRHFESLSVVERLRERRMVEVSRDTLRLEQKRLDEQALSKLSAEIKPNIGVNRTQE